MGQGPARPRGLAPPGLRSGAEGKGPGLEPRSPPAGSSPGAAGGGRGPAGHRGRLRARRGEGAGRCGRQPRGLRSAGVAPWQRVTDGERPLRAQSGPSGNRWGVGGGSVPKCWRRKSREGDSLGGSGTVHITSSCWSLASLLKQVPELG